MKLLRGQVALVVLLVSAMVMTVGLSMSKKAVVETKIDSDEELLKQAFNAAESGIDYYLGTGQKTWENVNSAGVSSVALVTTQNLGGGATLDFDEMTLQNEVVLFWLVGHDGSGNIDYTSEYSGSTPSVCVNNSFGQSLKVDYFYYDGGSVYRVKRYGYNVGGGTAVNGYQAVSPADNSCTVKTGYKQLSMGEIVAGERPLLVAVKPIGGGAKILLSGNASFPIQGEKISSTGKAGDVSSTARGASQRISIINQYRIPAFMIEAMTAAGSVLSN